MVSTLGNTFQEGKILLIDKPIEWTSFDVVKKIRNTISRKTGIRKIKVGHAGTLDPLATGLLIVCTGKFTKRINEFQGMEKEYTGTFFIGATTPSLDKETEIDNKFDTHQITDELLIR
ncbi:MAG: tRNA pseudouridine(55) synthase, partial [Bacteroidales bacterium]|nr:tRNA pseudouridine(55) synthase [Bacteroidales bacterium]